MLSSLVVSQIKACAERGDRVGEISAAFSISRQSVAKIISGRSHPKVRAARYVPALLKLQADREAAERRAERDAEHDRKMREAAAAAELKAALEADPDVQAALARLAALKRPAASTRVFSADKVAEMKAEWVIAKQAHKDAYERVEAAVSGTATPGSAGPERPPEPVKGPDRPPWPPFRPRRTGRSLSGD